MSHEKPNGPRTLPTMIVGVWDEMLPDDEYARAMAQLPDLPAEYQTPGE